MYDSLTDGNYFRGCYIFARNTLKICINRIKYGLLDMYELPTYLEPKNKKFSRISPSN